MSTSGESHDIDAASHRACANCRSQKVRCIPDEFNPNTCQRCARTGRPCIFTPLRKRKQRKRTDTRVAELEREMQTMRSMMRNKAKDSSSAQDKIQEDDTKGRPAGLWYTQNKPNAVPRDTVEEAAGNSGSHYAPQHQTGCLERPGRGANTSPVRPGDATQDVVDRDIISMATARQLFETYRRHLFPIYPVVAIPSSGSAEQIRRTKPTLFLAILAAAATKDNPDLSPTLDQEILHTFAMKSVVQSEKSLELIQALLISSAWYHPPNKYGQLKYYQYINMAATMALDLGIGMRPVPSHNRTGTKRESREGRFPAIHPLEDATDPDLSMTPRSRDSSPETGSLESRRTFLGCYSASAAVSLSLRRPNMLRATSYVTECVDYLERSPAALPSDSMLVSWIRLMMLAEEISSSFSYEDSSNTASIAELRTQMMMKQYTKRIDDWYAGVAEANLIGSLKIMYWTTRLYIFQIVLLLEHSPEDFKAPYQMGVFHTWNGDDIPTQVLADAVAECITCSQNLLDTFIGMDVESLRALPVFSYVRVSFAAFVLVKLCLSSVHPGSRIGTALERSSLKAESYLDQAVLHVRAVVGPSRCRVPAIFLALLFKLRQWCLNPKMIEQSEKMLEKEVESQTFEQNTQTRVQSTISSEHPRITEHNSSDESSPQTSLESHPPGQEEQFHGPSPQSQVPDFNTKSSNIGAMAVPATSSSLGPEMVSYPNAGDPMQLDQDFLQFFGNFNNGLGPIDLSGIEDWSSMSTDFLGFSNNFNWQATTYGDGTTRL